MLAQYVGLVLIFVMGLVLVATLLALHLLAGPGRAVALPRGPRAERLVASPQRRDAVRFYLIAMLFVVFDSFAIYFCPWGAVFRELGWYGFCVMSIFAAPLAVGLLYQWMKGALEW